MKSDEIALSTCLDTPNWRDKDGYGCDHYEDFYEAGCSGTEKWAGNLGPAAENCCYCGGGSHAMFPAISTSSICTEDTEGWFDQNGYDCVWYKVMDGPGCPNYGNQTAHKSSIVEGSANQNCCYCQIDVTNNVSPTVAPSSSETCVDTPGWRDTDGDGCETYLEIDDPGCPFYGTNYAGEMGSAAENCCYCKDPTCEHWSSRCQYLTTLPFSRSAPTPSHLISVCDDAAYSCCEADRVEIVTNSQGHYVETVGLYNECKCDFWSRLCEETQLREFCDHAAEYCCGDYIYYEADQIFRYLNSPQCYCDFYDYAENEFGQTLKPRALTTNEEFTNPCEPFEIYWSNRFILERESLKAIYNATNGHNWTNNDGWRNETEDHCQWYGISCDSDRLVTDIDLRDNNLAGQFPVYTRYEDSILVNEWQQSKYGLANLYTLKTLDLAENKLTGTIEYRPLYNLRDLSYFDLSGNQLSGVLDTQVSPSVNYADFSNNGFTSMRRFVQYKVSSLQSLRFCDVSNNAIQEDAADILENIPPNIEQFLASNNQMYGRLPASLDNLPKLRQLNMASNALSGDLPGFIESFITLQELDVSNQQNDVSFTGPIPDNVWRFLSLKVLNLADNRLTGTVPSLVGNLAVMEVFDLSNNLLDSSLPSELGMIGGSLKRLDFSSNAFTGTIPFQVGQLQGASVFLKDNLFQNTSTTAPLNLCLEREVNEFDLADDATLCPPERNALSDIYDSAKGAEWTNGSLWLDDYASYCDWKGVTCDDMNHVVKLNLTNNGLSGRLSESIGNLTFVKELDLSDNDIRGVPSAQFIVPLVYAFVSNSQQTNDARTLNLQASIPTELGKLSNLTYLRNEDDDCYPQEETKVVKWGLKDYGTFAAVLSACFIALCCMVAILLYVIARRMDIGNSLTSADATRIKENDMYALSKIGKDSVYSYFVTDNIFGWMAALTALCLQFGILVFFIRASEANLQNDRTDVQFTWKCPRDTDVCDDKADFTGAGWAIFSVLMVAFLSKDLISGSKLIITQPELHTLSNQGFAISLVDCVSTVYNKAIAISNTDIIVNAVVVLFVMDLDEWIFSTLEAINEDWTSHVALSDDEMKEQIASQQDKLRNLCEIVEKIQESQTQMEQIASQQEELKKMCEIVEKMQALYASAHSKNVWIRG
eukprot:scaffold28411_cov83-Skeletonema_dohrnii-CCMP3373.AAC.1